LRVYLIEIGSNIIINNFIFIIYCYNLQGEIMFALSLFILTLIQTSQSIILGAPNGFKAGISVFM